MDEIEKLDESKLQSKEDINRIVYTNGLYDKEEDTYISIADIVGYDYSWRNSRDIILSFDNYFNKQGTNYQTRSISMLNYSSEEIIDGLSKSFIKEPICIQEAERGIYTISTNGLHRYTILKMHYLNDLIKSTSASSRRALKEKYKIPVRIQRINYIKTYCNYLLDTFFSIDLYQERDGKGRTTGKTRIISEKKEIVMTDEELIKYTREKLKNVDSVLYENAEKAVSLRSEKYQSFQNFIQEYFSDIFKSKKGRLL